MKKRQDGAAVKGAAVATLRSSGKPERAKDEEGVKASALAGLKSGLRGIDLGTLNPHGTLIHVKVVVGSSDHQQMWCV